MDKSISAQMHELLTDYNEDVQEAVDKSAKESARSCVKELKNTSPKRAGHGEYARSWAVKKQETGMGVSEYVVHNKQHYQLTHLLENGHVIRNKKGTYGRTSPIKHIAPAADAATQKFEQSAKEKIEGIK